MKDVKIISVLFFSFILMISCAENKDNNAPKEDIISEVQSDSIILNEKIDKSEKKYTEGQSNVTQSYENSIIKLNIPGSVIETETLKEYLPKKIPGTEPSSPSLGVIYGETGNVTTVSNTYSFKNGGLVIIISDYGRKENISGFDLKYFNITPKDPTREVETIIDDIGKGYILWDSELRNGVLYYLLANRFIIKIEAYTLPPGSDLALYFNMIKRKSLLKTAKK